MVLKANSRFPTDILFKTLEVDKLKVHWAKQALVTIFNLLFNIGPPLLTAMIEFNTRLGYTLRSANTQIAIPRPHTNFLHNSPLYQASKLFNTLPVNLRIIKDVKLFSTMIKKIENIDPLLSSAS